MISGSTMKNCEIVTMCYAFIACKLLVDYMILYNQNHQRKMGEKTMSICFLVP